MKLKSLPPELRPRERLLHVGAPNLSDVELLAILLGSGTKECSVMELASKILAHFQNLKTLFEATIEELMEIKGLGKAKAVQLKAAFALSKRAFQTRYEQEVLDHPEEVFHCLQRLLSEDKKEHLFLVLRDVKRRIIHQEVVCLGTLTEVLIHPREVFAPAIRRGAHSVIIAHNHPSGDLTASKQDLELTKKLIEAGELLKIRLVDHLIISPREYSSLFMKGYFPTNFY